VGRVARNARFLGLTPLNQGLTETPKGSSNL
jgi:hypothetical protein